jgi:hypothetical protein
MGIICEGFTVGSHPLVIRFLKGVYNLRPTTSRYCQTWDVSIVLNYLKTLWPVTTITLKQLTLKLAMLIALSIAGRSQSLHLLTIENMRKVSSSVTLFYSDLLKQSRPGVKTPFAELKTFSLDQKLCVVHTLYEYLKRTDTLRGENKCLFISYVKPHKPVTKNTISRWLKTVMFRAGIDCNLYKPHSVRSASVSKAKLNSVPIDEILKVAGWSNAKTFGKFYDKVIVNSQDNYSDAVFRL